MATTEEYLAEARSGISSYTLKVEILDEEENVLREVDGITDGDISRTLQIGARASGTVSINNGDGGYSLTSDATDTTDIWLNNKFQVSTGLNINDVDEYYTQGVFVIGEYNESSSSDGQSIVEYTLYDKMTYLDGTLSGMILNSFTIDLDTNITQSIRVVLEQAESDGIQLALDAKALITVPIDDTLPYTLYVEAGGTYYDIIEELAEIVNYTFYFDKQGFPNFVPLSEPDEEPSVLNIPNDDKIKISVDRSLSVSEIKNRIKATGTDWDDGVIYDYTATKTDGGTGTDRIGLRAELVENDLLSTETQAEDLANYDLDLGSRVGETITLTGIPLDILTEGDIVEINNDITNLYDERFQLTQIDIPLLKDTTGSYEMERTVEL